ncbi:MAG: hypothetical protein Q9210_000064 [Variospora velana]
MMTLHTAMLTIPTARQTIRILSPVGLLLVLCTLLFRTYWLDVHDPFKCQAVLSRGHWLDPPAQTHSTLPFQQWQPPGCILHEYARKDIRTCLQGQRIVFIGDSTTRQLFWATAKKLNATAADEEMRAAGKHENLMFNEGDVAVDFIWDPFLNSSSLRHELLSYLNGETQEDVDNVWKAGLITVGGGLWYARHFELDSLNRFQDSFDYLSPLLSVPRNSVQTLYSPPSGKRRDGAHHVYVAPVQIPFYDVLSPARAATMTPAKIRPLNEHLYNVSTLKGIKVAWSHLLMTWEREQAYEESGIHVIDSVSIRRVDVLLNMRCNAHLTLSQGYPFDKTCCSAYERKNVVRKRLILALIAIASIIMGFWVYNQRRMHGVLSNEMVQAVGTVVLVLTYCFLADRTQLFNKSQKHFSTHEFVILCGIVLSLGIFSLRRSVARTAPGLYRLPKEKVADQPFLSRDQTDEWKGWMQFAILIYHYTGASSVLGIYQLIRILVASYLFMTGFGHTLFFYQKQDYSLKRSAAVLIRLNMLSCLLPYIMATDYLFYYFAPLVSFWYVVVYVTMCISQSRNSTTTFLLAKIGASAVVVTGLVRVPTLFEGLFFLLQHTCQIHWNVKEWRFRLQLDNYIVYVGMMAAVLYIRLTDILHGQRFPTHDGAGYLRHHWSKIRILSAVFGLSILPGSWLFARTFTDKFGYNRWVPYVSPFPVVAFIILRNSNRYFRNYYFFIFAWLGRCSLETFTLQFHIWLAADTKGLLSLGVFGRKKTHIEGRHEDLVVLSIIFLWLSWLTADATATITNWIVDPNGRRSPRTTDTSGLPTKRHELETIINIIGRPSSRASIIRKWGQRLCVSWMGRLELRIYSILLVMWLLNMARI